MSFYIPLTVVLLIATASAEPPTGGRTGGVLGPHQLPNGTLEESDMDGISLLQLKGMRAISSHMSEAYSHVTKSMASSGCPEECMTPQCQSGFAPFEGWKSLYGDTCYYTCSGPQTGGVRFCGDGPDFKTHGSVDCSSCVVKLADFRAWTRSGSISGKITIEKKSSYVQWYVESMSVDPGLISKYCGKLVSGQPTFMYHMHEHWNFPAHQTSSVGDCSLANVGNHWDPTAACGPASGNPVCDEQYCNTRGMNYTCDSSMFDPNSEAQYRLLSPSALFPSSTTCEFGDFSGMAGPIKGKVEWPSQKVVTEPKTGRAAMSATFGEISPWTLEGQPCSYGNLPMSLPKANPYKLASVKYPLDQFPEDASVLVHCGMNYENSGARFFCAKLQ
jgi:hypothetical protein